VGSFLQIFTSSLQQHIKNMTSWYCQQLGKPLITLNSQLIGYDYDLNWSLKKKTIDPWMQYEMGGIENGATWSSWQPRLQNYCSYGSLGYDNCAIRKPK